MEMAYVPDYGIKNNSVQDKAYHTIYLSGTKLRTSVTKCAVLIAKYTMWRKDRRTDL